MPEAGLDWRSARLRKHADYQRVYQASRRYSSQSMSYFFRDRKSGGEQPPASFTTPPAGLAKPPAGLSTPPAGLATPRVGLTTPRALGGAVERNRIRRRMREAVRAHMVELPAGVDVVLHPRRSVLDIEFSRLDREVARLFAGIRAQVAAVAGVKS